MPTMNTGLGGPAGYGESVFSTSPKYFGGNDDGVVQVDVTSVFGASGISFYGTNYTEIYINSNGLISFGNAHWNFNALGWTSVDLPALVPFYTDYDITIGGEIYWDLDPANNRITITWDNVQEFGGSGANSHQVVITSTGGGGFDVEFIYESIGASVSGGVTAVAGYSDGITEVPLEGSGNAAFMLGYASNDFDNGDPVGTVTFSDPGPVSNGIVDGTASGDTMAFGYTDTDGDAITSGDDVIEGNGGNDTIDGDAGNDTILGGLGSDSVEGGTGADSIVGGDGDDTLSGGGGSDTIFGGDGNDNIGGGGTPDLLHGDDGNDTLRGSGGADTIVGGIGADSIEGGTGADLIDGGTGADTLQGGLGDDSLEGGDGNDTFVYAFGDGHDTLADFNVGSTGTISDGNSTNNDFIDLSAFYDNIHELYADQVDDGVLNQSNTTDAKGRMVDYSDNSQFALGDSLTFSGASADNSFFTVENTALVCFAAGTLIRTLRGNIPIEALRRDESVVTMDNGPQPLLWSTAQPIDAATLQKDPNLRPILVSGQIAVGGCDLLVSPQHAMLIELRGEERLIRAKHLCEGNRQLAHVVNNQAPVVYFHLAFDGHQIIFANNCPTESFYPGAYAIASLSDKARTRLFDHFPDLGQRAPPAWCAARPYLKRRELVDSGWISRKRVSNRGSVNSVSRDVASAAVLGDQLPA